MPLHLHEHVVIVERATHGLQFLDRGDLLFAISVLGSDQEGGTANQLVVALVDHSFGAVTVEQVDGEEQCLGEQLKSHVRFHQEVEQVGSHVPLNLSLNVNGVDIGHSVSLRRIVNLDRLDFV